MFKEKDIPRGIRNNNPGNIERTKEKWQGLSQVQRDSRFFTFERIEWGYRAMLKLLSNYINLKGLNTIALIIGAWAPGHENNTEAYICKVCRLTGMSRDQKLVANEATLKALSRAISDVENGRPAVERELKEGWKLFQQYP